MADENSQNGGQLTPAPKCPICAKPRELKYRPFCSKRCQQVDLGRWLGEVYTIPVTELDDEDGEEPGAPPARRSRDD